MNPITAVDGWKTYLCALATLGGALYQAVIVKDYAAAYQLLVLAGGMASARHAISKVADK